MIKVLSKRERMILYVTGGVIIFSIGFNLLLSPILNKNTNLNKEINITRVKLKKYLWLLSQKDYIQEKYNKFFASIQSADKKEAAVSILSEIENLAKASDIRIIEIRPERVAAKPDLYHKTIIDLRTEGTLEGYLKFIYSLETSPLFLSIKKFQLTTRVPAPTAPTLEGNFSISQLVSSSSG